MGRSREKCEFRVKMGGATQRETDNIFSYMSEIWIRKVRKIRKARVWFGLKSRCPVIHKKYKTNKQTNRAVVHPV